MVKNRFSRFPVGSRASPSATLAPDIHESLAASTSHDSLRSLPNMLLTPPTSASASNAPSEVDASKSTQSPSLDAIVVADTVMQEEGEEEEEEEDEEEEEEEEEGEEDLGRRKSARSRNTVKTYNDKYLSGSAVHTRRSYRKDGDPWSHALKNMESLHRTVSGVTLVNDEADSPSKQLLEETTKAFDTTEESSEIRTIESTAIVTRRRSMRTAATTVANVVASSASVLGKRSRDALDSAKGRMLRSRVPKPEPAILKSEPVKKRMFPNLVLTDSEEEESSEEEEEDSEEDSEDEVDGKRPKKFWLSQGLYVGQTREESRHKGKGRQSTTVKSAESKYLPLPMFTGAKLLEVGRDFRLPYDVLNPLPKAEHPRDWLNVKKNRFVGDAKDSWRKDKEEWNKCQCLEDDPCGEDCLNRTMRYECNEGNCNVEGSLCKNRSFAELKWRKEGKNASRNPVKRESNMWGDGIEVTQTDDRGHGVRAMRSFESGQIIVEYTGEIITQSEADERMNGEYKDHKNYYMMTFHKGLIIDGYRGSICRFVNHSCDPNCIVEKWTVDGQPRMALFAGVRAIEVGEEITYDYNFAPFSEKNTQACHCGATNCRGVLGPKTAEPRKPESKALKTLSTISKAIDGAKRKLLGGSAPGTPNKRRKLTPLTPDERNKKTGPRSQAAPAVLPVSKQTTELQQVSRAARALKRTIEVKKSSRGRTLKERHSIHTFPVPQVTPKRDAGSKRKSVPVASSKSIKSMVGSVKKAGSAIASRTNNQRKELLALPKKSRAASGSSSTSRLLSKNSQGKLKQSRLSLNESALSIEVPDTPTSVLRQSARAHKPSPKVLENSLTIKPQKDRKASSVLTSVTTQSHNARKFNRASSAQKDYWDLSSDDERGSSKTEKKHQIHKTPEDSPRRLSKRAIKPSPKVLENALLLTSASSSSSLQQNNKLTPRAKSRLSLTASLKSVAKVASSGTSSIAKSARKGQAFWSAGRHGDKAITKTMRKISGAV